MYIIWALKYSPLRPEVWSVLLWLRRGSCSPCWFRFSKAATMHGGWGMYCPVVFFPGQEGWDIRFHFRSGFVGMYLVLLLWGYWCILEWSILKGGKNCVYQRIVWKSPQNVQMIPVCAWVSQDSRFRPATKTNRPIEAIKGEVCRHQLINLNHLAVSALNAGDGLPFYGWLGVVISSLGIAGAKNSAINSSFWGEGIQFFAQWKGLQNNPSFRLHVTPSKKIGGNPPNPGGLPCSTSSWNVAQVKSSRWTRNIRKSSCIQWKLPDSAHVQRTNLL